MTMPQYSLKIPQRPYDGDTFAIALVPSSNDYFMGSESSYVLNNVQPEDCKTKIYYNGKLWGPNELIPLTTKGHFAQIDSKPFCSARAIQYFTYNKSIDTWICYWQNVVQEENLNKCTITVYVIAGDSQIKLLPKSPITEGNHGFETIGKITYTASIGSRFNRITYGDLIDAVGYQGEKNSESIKDIVRGKKNYTYTGRGATFLCSTDWIGFSDFDDRGMKIFGGVNGVTKYIPGLSLSRTTHDFRVNRWEINIPPGGGEVVFIIDRYTPLGLEELEEFIDTPIGIDFIVEGNTVINLLFCHEEMLGYIPPFYTDTGEVNENPRLPGEEGNPYYGYYGYPTP